MKTLVTGGAGFIGSHLVDELINRGYDVVVIDNEVSNGNEGSHWNPKAENYKLDIREYEQIKDLFQGVDFVFHLAAESRIQPAIENPIQAVSINSLGTCTVLQCAREAGVKRLMFSSTSAIYGNNQTPNQETNSIDCINPYSVSKHEGEMLCKMYSNLYGLETIVFRYFNVYGDRQPIKGAHAPVMGVFLKQREEGKSLTVVGDGSQRRDFVNVKDIVEANILGATAPLKQSEIGTVFNIGSGVNFSILEIANMISDSIVHLDSRVGESAETLADITKARTLLSWKPTISLLQWINIQLAK